MKKKLLMFIIRLIRLFKAEDTFIPNLRSVPDGKVKDGRLYRYYGRILVARPWNEKPRFRYCYKDDEGDFCYCSEIKYNEILRSKGPDYVRCSAENNACHLCACFKLGLPCRCDFINGTCTGYYELVHTDTQYSDNITL